MSYRRRRACPICGKPNLLWPSHHLRQVHGLSSEARQPWLQRASHLPPVDVSMELMNCPPSRGSVIPNSPIPCLMDNRPLLPTQCLDIQPHPDFTFQHPYSMMVVGPSQCGKTHFVHQLLTHKCTVYPRKKPVLVCWYYNQWQPKYAEIQGDLKNKIHFAQGLPELEEDLSNINPSKHTIIVLDDLTAQATDSPVVSKLFTQGRHRNASVILLLQNMFPKGKYNTDISRNATYKVLFRSPGDRKQIDIMAEQTFAKDRPRFMQAYSQETDRPYGYIVVDNHPRTTSEHQVVANVLGNCYTYPHITSTSLPTQSSTLSPHPEQSVTVTRKRQAPVISQSEVRPSKKRKVVQKAPVITQPKKRQGVQKKSNKRKAVPINKRKLQNKPRKQPVYDYSEDNISEEGGDEEITSEEDDSDSVEGEGGDDPVHEEENQNGGGTWHYPKINLIPPHTGIGVGTRRR